MPNVMCLPRIKTHINGLPTTEPKHRHVADAFQTQVQLCSGGDTIAKPEHLVLSPAMALGQISQLSGVQSPLCVEEERAHTTTCYKGQNRDCVCNALSLVGRSSHCTAVLHAFHGPSDSRTCGLQAL